MLNNLQEFANFSRKMFSGKDTLSHKRILILFFGFAYTIGTFGQSPFSSDVDSLILKGFDYTFVTQFDSAMMIYQKLTEEYPNHPVGYFYQAATLQSKMMDRESTEDEILFNQLIETALEKGEACIENNGEDPWVLFYLGSAHSYKGLFQAKSGGLVKGFISAKKGLDYLEDTVKQDETIYDAYLGLGNYKYWAGKYYKYLRWLPWIRDERNEGIQMIKTVIEKSTFSYWVGINSLGWIEVDRENYKEAAVLFQKGLDVYPESRFFLWGLGASYLKDESWIQAMVAYKRILDSLEGEKQNGYNEAECRLKLAQCYFALRYYRECQMHADAILNLEVTSEIKGRIGKHLKEAKKLKTECQKHLDAAQMPSSSATTSIE